MILTLTGENNFDLRQALRRLVDDFCQEHGDLALERIDCEEAGIERIRESITSLPFLAAKKLVVLSKPSTNKQFTEQAEQILDDTPETTDVIIVEPKPDKRTAYYKFLKKNTDFKEFPELDSNGLAKWLAETAKARQGSIKPADARYLVERVGVNQLLLSNELEKLLLYSPDISRQSIDLLTEPAPQSTIFELLDAAFAGNTKKAAALYAEQRALKVEPAQIIAMLAWQLHVLAIIKASGDEPAEQVARSAKLNPFVVRKSQGIARRLSLAELRKLVGDLLQIDIAMKRTNIDADEALQHYLLAIAR
ncbi:MAG TPA: DNA polymerase III subunit delta [Candidatus Saccharimonadales bacterium]|nr:DNA polymerase III subunit delta [Candidatus Saccharimonadales bacterium]